MIAILYQQQAAEYKALCLQAHSRVTQRKNEAIKQQIEKDVKSIGLRIYYVSNREENDTVVRETLLNMQRRGFPQCDTNDQTNFLFMTNRQTIGDTNREIVLLLGQSG